MTSFKDPLAHKNQAMTKLHRQIIEQKNMLRRVQAVLPEDMAKQARHCVVKNDVLLLYVDSNAWASTLRFHSPAILAAVEPLAPHLTKVELRLIMQAIGSLVTPPIRKANLPCDDTIETLRKDSLAVKDEDLKNALLSLNSTLARLSKNKGNF